MSRGVGVAAAMAPWILALAAGSAAAGERGAPARPAPDPAVVGAADAAPPGQDAAPRWSARSSLVDGQYRSSLSRGRLDLGLAFDTPARTLRPGDAPLDPVVAHAVPAPILSLGLRSSASGAVATAGSLLERATGASSEPQAERRVGLEWRPAKSRVFLNRGVGIRLGDDDRVTMRLRKGSLGIFMQTAF